MSQPLTEGRSVARQQIVEAAAELLHRDGPAAVTTRAVAAAAGTQAPTIYRLFGDKDGLLDAVAEHVMTTLVAAKASEVAAAAAVGTDPVEELTSGWRTMVAFGTDNPALFRLLSDPQRIQTSPAARAGREALAARVARVAAAGRLKVSERRAVDLITAAAVGVISTLASQRAEDRDETLAETMWGAVLGQLTMSRVRRPGRQDFLARAVALRADVPGLTELTAGERAVLVEWLDRIIG